MTAAVRNDNPAPISAYAKDMRRAAEKVTTAALEQLAADLQAWCHRAEASGIAVLQEFSMKLRAARA